MTAHSKQGVGPEGGVGIAMVERIGVGVCVGVKLPVIPVGVLVGVEVRVLVAGQVAQKVGVQVAVRVKVGLKVAVCDQTGAEQVSSRTKIRDPNGYGMVREEIPMIK